MSDRLVLIVDDDAGFREHIELALRYAGYEVLSASGAAEACELALEHCPSVVLFALRLANGSADKLLADVTAICPSCLAVAVVERGDRVAALHALEQGAHQYIEKPVHPVELQRLLDMAFEGRRLREEKCRAEEQALAHKRQLESMRQRLREVAECTISLAMCSDPTAVGQTLLKEFARNLCAGGGSLFLRTNGDLRLSCSLDPGHAPPAISMPPPAGTVFHQVVSTRQPILVTDIHGEAGASPSGWTGYQDGSLIAFPLLDRSGEVIGVLSLHNRASPPFTPADLELGRILVSFGVELLRTAHAKEKLRASERQYDRLIALCPDPIVVVQEGRILLASAAFTEVFGYAASDVEAGLSCHQLIAADAEDVGKLFDECLGEADTTRGRRISLVAKDASPVPCEVNSADIELGGRPARLLLIRNLSARAEAEEALRKERDFVSAILNTARALIVVFDPQGHIVRFNDACEETTLYTLEEVQERPFWETLISSEEREEARAAFEALTGGRYPIPHESHWLTKDGRRCFISWASTCLLDHQGQVEFVISTGIDITARRETQAKLDEREGQLAQLHKLEAIGRLAGGVAHDFNNLLTAIICCSELLAEQLPDDPSIRQYLNEILKAGERGTSLVRQLMAFSRSQVLEPTVLDLNATVHDMEQMLRYLIGEDIQLSSVLDPDLDSVKADQGQIEMAIMNLAVNARDAMPDGGRLTLSTRNVVVGEQHTDDYPDIPSGRYVELGVAGAGVGVSEEIQAHVFEPFFTTKGPGEGTGLGLSTVYGIVKQSGGYIRIESAPGQGATFCICLPATLSAAKLTSRRPVAAEALRGSETVLIVEDEDPVRELACAILVNQGYNVLEAASPGDALLLCQQRDETIHLLLTDIVMPLMNGFELAERVSALHPEMKVLYMSAYAANVLVRYGDPESSCAAVLQKPFSRERLVHKIREVLDVPQREPSA